MYNATVANEPLVHFHGRAKWGGRLLTHFYSFLFLQDWRQDLWTKRLVRDQLRYRDENRYPITTNNNQQAGQYYSAFHVRRGEFQYKKTRVSATELYNMSRTEIGPGTTVYMATDERHKSFFHDLSEHYDLVFLNDYAHLLKGIITNYHGILDQLVASRAEIFFGCWFST